MATHELPNSPKPKKKATWYFFYLPFIIIIGLVMLNVGHFYLKEHLSFSSNKKESVSKEKLEEYDTENENTKSESPKKSLPISVFPTKFGTITTESALYDSIGGEQIGHVDYHQNVAYSKLCNRMLFCVFENKAGMQDSGWVNMEHVESVKKNSETEYKVLQDSEIRILE